MWFSSFFFGIDESPKRPKVLAINEAGRDLIRVSEGYSAVPYLCSSNVATIAIGATIDENGYPVTLDHPRINPYLAEMLFSRDLLIFSNSVKALCKVPLNANQFSALCSLCYNIGAGNFRASTLLRKLNRGDYEGASGEFWKWRRSRGRIMRGLVTRREKERRLFVS